ncbi:MAG TPA: patatin-like phospholipase family protein [Myxococcales bacterium]
MATISVLSIDGGGIRGMIPAAFLNRLEQRTGHRVSDLFDYVAGTSTGGILALGLGANRPGCNSPYTAEQLVRLYKTEGGRIFSRSLLHFARALDNLNGPRFPEYGIDEVLKRYFGDTRLKDARTNVVVTAYAIEQRRPFFFRSWQAKAPGTRRTHDFPVWEVARSTSAAPTLFPPFKATAADGKSYALIDGGVYANNPALCAWVEARDRHPRHDILVVSLGTGNENRAVDFHRSKRWGLAGWARPLIDVIFDGVSDTVHVQLDEMLNPGDARKYFRFQQDIPPAQQALDNTSAENLTALRRIGEAMAQGKKFEDLCAQLGAIAAERTALNQVA